MKIYSIFAVFAVFAVCCLVVSCSTDDASSEKPNFKKKSEISNGLNNKEADTIAGEPVPIKDKD